MSRLLLAFEMQDKVPEHMLDDIQFMEHRFEKYPRDDNTVSDDKLRSSQGHYSGRRVWNSRLPSNLHGNASDRDTS